MAKPAEFAAYPRAMRLPYGPYMAAVSRVIDGDTFVALVDVGFDTYACPVVRLARINAPEMSDAGGHESKDHLAGLVFPDGGYGDQPGPVQVEAKSKDPYGRYVCEVTLPDGSNLSDALAMGGWAEYHDY